MPRTVTTSGYARGTRLTRRIGCPTGWPEPSSQVGRSVIPQRRGLRRDAARRPEPAAMSSLRSCSDCALAGAVTEATRASFCFSRKRHPPGPGRQGRCGGRGSRRLGVGRGGCGTPVAVDDRVDELRRRVEEQRRRLNELHAHHKEQRDRVRAVRASIRELLELLELLELPTLSHPRPTPPPVEITGSLTLIGPVISLVSTLIALAGRAPAACAARAMPASGVPASVLRTHAAPPRP